ncbi:hypothetical protein BG011_003128 [Mortierella polycephala]|uniref:FAD-binding domain-containing protein n=1 Tax=Mortierella polycephala TaxID=41804 RepID=A0A9P6QI72_9FUNG|nr:hypothetical protein BG011_003128 [Mortierella polycephala]
MSYEENEFGVNICCSDNTVYTGDLLVGADGAYSRIRQTMQRQLEKKGLLRRPIEKQQQIPNYVCMLGVAQPGNPERYQCLKDPFVNFSSVMGGNGLGWNVINIPDDKICWSLWIQLDVSSLSQEVLLQDDEWTSKNNDKMISVFRRMPCPYGGTMGELIDATPPDLISKVFLEEQLFETWHHGRTVLIGDSCHTMLPGAGQGATNAMQDAVILANCLVELKDLKLNTIRFALEDFQEQRYRHARRQYLYSKMVSKLMSGQRIYEDTATYRPQVCFLPPTENRGSGYVLPQNNRQYSEDEAKAQVATLWGHSDEKTDIIDGDDETEVVIGGGALAHFADDS